jgi:hypothetical protein
MTFDFATVKRLIQIGFHRLRSFWVKSEFKNPTSPRSYPVMAPPGFLAWYRMVNARVLNFGTSETTIPAKAPNGQR